MGYSSSEYRLLLTLGKKTFTLGGSSAYAYNRKVIKQSRDFYNIL